MFGMGHGGFVGLGRLLGHRLVAGGQGQHEGGEQEGGKAHIGNPVQLGNAEFSWPRGQKV